VATSADPPELDLSTGSPPRGRVSITASAGTGKTYALTQLVVLNVIRHGLEAGEVLLVTFTRAATAELRHKTRQMCLEAIGVLAAGDATRLPWLASIVADDTLRASGRERLERFLARYDEVTISTIHGFCRRILRRAGLAGSVPATFTLVSNIDEVVDRLVTDGLAHEISKDPLRFVRVNPIVPSTPTLAQMQENRKATKSSVTAVKGSVKIALDNPSIEVFPKAPPHSLSLPPGAESSESARKSTDVAERIATTVEQLASNIRQWCVDHLLVSHSESVRLAAESLDPTNPSPVEVARAAALAHEISALYRLVMVDEFQDTDALQWRIFNAIHRHGDGTHNLVTVGDAKQAIYGFRGADVGVYVAAENAVSQRFKISTNRRSSRRLIAALDDLFTRNDDGAPQGYKFDPSGSANYTRVTADPSKIQDLVINREGENPPRIADEPLEIRWLASHGDLGAKQDRDPNVAEKAQDVIDHDLANRVAELLAHGEIPDRDLPPGQDGRFPMRRVVPSDIAVLVRTRKNSDGLTACLREVGIPVVQSKSDSVVQSEAARHWLMFLDGTAHPHRPRKVRARALTVFGAHDPTSLLSVSDDEMGELQEVCSEDARVLSEFGLTAMYLRHRSTLQFLDRVLSRPDGERMLTDLDHLAELLSSHPMLPRAPAPLEVLGVLEEIISNTSSEDDDDQPDERKRRIETDDAAVKVMTIHASKGLQFPVVILPDLHRAWVRVRPPYTFSHDFGSGRTRVVDAGSDSTSGDNSRAWEFSPRGVLDRDLGKWGQRKNASASEDEFDLKRLLYVALTRAEFKVVAYWSRLRDNYTEAGNKSPWPDLLEWSIPGENLRDDLPAAMNALGSLPSGSIATREFGPGLEPLSALASPTGVSTASGAPLTHADLQGLAEDRIRLKGWQRWSYSGLTRLLKRGAPSPAPKGTDVAHGFDERDHAAEPTEVDRQLAVAPASDGLTALGSVPGSTRLGNLVHEVIDAVDPASVTADADVRAAVDERLGAWPRIDDPDSVAAAVTEGIVGSFDKPLGPGFGSHTLATLGRRHRLSELHFDFNLGQDSSFPLAEIGRALSREPGLRASIARYADTISDTRFDSHRVAGFMNGSIDAVFRASDDDGTRFMIVDYKTDTVHGRDEEQKWLAYETPRLDALMAERGYIFQVLVYSVALHRFLRWRLGDNYDFDTHFGGATYLFLRGLTGDLGADGVPRGVWHWRPSRTLVESLDRLFSVGSAGS